MNRRGVTLIEMLIVVVVMGILARFALPRVEDARRRAVAATIVSELNVIRDAAYHYNADLALWPLNTAVGKVPAGLSTYLVGGLSWTPKTNYSYVWLLSGMTGGDPATGTNSSLMGPGVSTTDAALRSAVVKAFGNRPSYVSGNVAYLLIWGPARLRP